MRFILIISLLLSSIVITTSQTLQWRILPNAPVAVSRHEDVFFINEIIGWILSNEGKIFRTTDGGASWQIQFNTPFTYFRSLGFSDAMNGWAGVIPNLNFPKDTNILYRTTNGGLNWNLVQNFPSPKPTGVCGISVVNNNVMYGSGRWRYDTLTSAWVIKTTNGGNFWQTFNLSSMATILIDCYFTSADSGIVVGGIGAQYLRRRGIILFTSNGGSNWITRYVTPDSAQWCWKINFISRDIGFISLEKNSGGPTYYLKTTNRGVNWEQKLFLNTFYDEEGIGFINESLRWIGGWSTQTYKTTDGGISWAQDNFGYNINRFRIMNDTLSYAVGKHVYRYSRYPIGIKPISSEVPSEFNLFQNYPNPFNASTKFKIQISKLSDVKVTVFDILGREVETIVNEQLNAGTYEVEWDALSCPAGTYFYKLQAGDFMGSRKMVLIK